MAFGCSLNPSNAVAIVAAPHAADRLLPKVVCVMRIMAIATRGARAKQNIRTPPPMLTSTCGRLRDRVG
jgi:hypothetical protein